MKKILIKFFSNPIFIFLLRKIIQLLLKNSYIFKVQQRMNNYDVLANEFKNYLNNKNKNILEIGCSTGNLARAIIDMNGNSYCGIDISKKNIERATKDIPKGRFLYMNARKLDFEKELFDIVMLHSILHHVDDDAGKNCLKETYRVLKKDGKVLITEPTVDHNSFTSTIMCKLDRGEYIRKPEEYKNLFKDFLIERSGFFKNTGHKFCSFVLKK